MTPTRVGGAIIIAPAGVRSPDWWLLEEAPPRRFGVMHLDAPDDFDTALDEAEPAAWE